MSDSTEQGTPPFALHPIQLQYIAVRELKIKTHRMLPHSYELSGDEVAIAASTAPYDAESKTVQVSMRAKVGEDDDLTSEQEESLPGTGKPLVQMSVVIVGQFLVDEEAFPMDMLDEWTEKGGAMSLFPYLREQVYSLTARAGITPFLMPLMQLPTIKVERPKAADERQETGE